MTTFLIWKFSSAPSSLDCFVCLQLCFGGMGSHVCHRNPIKNISYVSVFFNEKPASALHSSPIPQVVSVTARLTVAAGTSLLLATVSVPSAGHCNPKGQAAIVIVHRSHPTFFVPYLSVVSEALLIPWEV